MKDWKIKNMLVIFEMPAENKVGELQVIGATGISLPFTVTAFDEGIKNSPESNKVNTELEIGCKIRLKNGAHYNKFRHLGKEYGHVDFYEIMAIEPIQ